LISSWFGDNLKTERSKFASAFMLVKAQRLK